MLKHDLPAQVTPARIRQRARAPSHQSTAGSFTSPELHDLDLSSLKIETVPLISLRGANRQLRRRDKDRIASLADRMREHRAPLAIFAFDDGEIAWGADLLEAYRLAGSVSVPVLQLPDRAPGERAALRLYLDRAFSEGELDPTIVKVELETVCELAPDWLPSTHMTSVEIDYAIHFKSEQTESEMEQPALEPKGPSVTLTGDLWIWPSGHRLICGSSRTPEAINRLMAGEQAHLLGGDPPYGTTVARISGSHAEWKEGSGMSDEEAEGFHRDYLAATLPALRAGALIYLFMDWKGLHPLLSATRAAGLVQKSLCTWDKRAPGQGGLYRNQSEHIYVGQHGKRPKGTPAPKRRQGRTTIWTCPGYASFRPDRKQALADHACTKPQAILMDLLQDATQIGDVCLDPFGGSGSMMVAAQRLKRRCYSVEIDESFCDIAVRRMFELTGEYPIEEATGLSFDALAEQRGVSLPTQGEA